MRWHLAFLALLIGCGGSTESGTSASASGQSAGITGVSATGGRSYVPVPTVGGSALSSNGGNSGMGGSNQSLGGTNTFTGGAATGGPMSTGGIRTTGGYVGTGGDWQLPCGASACTAINANCGTVVDGCGVPQDCGSCPSTGPWFCGLVTPNQCYGCEVPKTCADFPPGTCGLQANGCGVLLDCGPCSTCDLPKTCEQVCAVSNSVPTCSSVYDAASGFVVRCQQPTGCTDSPIQYCWCFIG